MVTITSSSIILLSATCPLSADFIVFNLFLLLSRDLKNMEKNEKHRIKHISLNPCKAILTLNLFHLHRHGNLFVVVLEQIFGFNNIYKNQMNIMYKSPASSL